MGSPQVDGGIGPLGLVGSWVEYRVFFFKKKSITHKMPFPPTLRIAHRVMQGAKAIAEMLKKNSSLRVLELNNNMIEYSVCIFPKLILIM